MKAACSHCGMEHILKDAEIAGHTKVQFHCSKCRQTTVVEITLRPDQTMVISPLPSFARSNASRSNLNLLREKEDDGLKLPAAKTATLTVVSGPSKGAVHNLKKPRVILGREDANIVLNDQEISRHHCLLEVRDNYANLKDLDSTNGTFFEEERVRAAMLQDGAEFRIGNSVIRFSLVSK
jgi:Inner membrane component of T3SS, cytoplasmic domain